MAAVAMPRAQGYLSRGPNKFTSAPAHSTLSCFFFYTAYMLKTAVYENYLKT